MRAIVHFFVGCNSLDTSINIVCLFVNVPMSAVNKPYTFVISICYWRSIAGF